VTLISVVVPTVGRSTLRRTISVIRRQSRGDLEVIVVSDGPQPAAERIAKVMQWPSLRFLEGPSTGNWGNAQRMVGLSHARGRYVMFIDDDDEHRRGAFDAVRAAIERSPGRILIFRMHRLGAELWTDQDVRLANVGTPMFAIPNVPAQVGSWLTKDRLESDFDFLRECISLQGDPIWNETVIVDAPQLPYWRLARRAVRPRARIRSFHRRFLRR
jgi:glycosyltransferase involved in cell wall biosynthesis